MTAGIPGTGIGGIFYLISAFVMPLFEIYKTVCGRSSVSRWLLIARQLAMALFIIAGMWLLGLGFGLMLHERPELEIIRTMQGHVSANLEYMTQVNIFHIAPLVMSSATLLFILSVTHMLRLIYRPLLRG